MKNVMNFIKKYWFQSLLFFFLGIFVAVLIVLLVWALFTSVKENVDFLDNVMGIPQKWRFDNYTTVLKNFKMDVSKVVVIDGKKYHNTVAVELFPDIIYNTVVYTLGSAFARALAPCIVAYVAAKFDKWKISKLLYVVVIVTMIIPSVGTGPATIKVAQAFGVYDNLWGNLILKFNFNGMYFLVYLSSFKMVAKDYTEAAYLDGANDWMVFFKIIFPLVRNIFGTIMLINFIEFWNDYGAVLLYLPTHPTLAYGIFRMSTTTITGLSTAPIRIAGAMIIFVPTLILFVAFQNKLLGNLSTGGVKE